MDFSFYRRTHAIGGSGENRSLPTSARSSVWKTIETSSDVTTRRCGRRAPSGLLAPAPESLAQTGGGLLENLLDPGAARAKSGSAPTGGIGRLQPPCHSPVLAPRAARAASSRLPRRHRTAQRGPEGLGRTAESVCYRQSGRDGWRLTGVKVGVPVATRAAVGLVPARRPTASSGCSLVTLPLRAFNWPNSAVTGNAGAFRAAPGCGRTEALLGSLPQGEAILNGSSTARRRTMRHRLRRLQEALRITAEYASNRKQFANPSARFKPWAAPGRRLHRQ